MPFPKRSRFNKAGELKEHYEQAAYIKWVREQEKMFPTDRRFRMIFAVPNGGKRDIITAAIMKSEGVKRGVPDIMVAVPVGRSHGLFIEVKSQDMEKDKKGGIKDEQTAMHGDLIMLGYTVVACYNCNQMIDATMNYLDNKKPETITVPGLIETTNPPRSRSPRPLPTQ